MSLNPPLIHSPGGWDEQSTHQITEICHPKPSRSSDRGCTETSAKLYRRAQGRELFQHPPARAGWALGLSAQGWLGARGSPASGLPPPRSGPRHRLTASRVPRRTPSATMPAQQKKLIFCTAGVLSFACALGTAAAVGTQLWVRGTILCTTGALLVNATGPELHKFIGEIQYGLFSGQRVRQCGLGGRPFQFSCKYRWRLSSLHSPAAGCGRGLPARPRARTPSPAARATPKQRCPYTALIFRVSNLVYDTNTAWLTSSRIYNAVTQISTFQKIYTITLKKNNWGV